MDISQDAKQAIHWHGTQKGLDNVSSWFGLTPTRNARQEGGPNKD